MSDKVRVRFLEYRKVEDDEGEEFHEGQEYLLTPDSAAHWISRGVAERVKETKKVAPAEDKKPPAKKPAAKKTAAKATGKSAQSDGSSTDPAKPAEGKTANA